MHDEPAQPSESYTAGCIFGSLAGAVILPTATAALAWFLYSIFGVQAHDVSYAFALSALLPIVGAVLCAFTSCASVAASWDNFRGASSLCFTGGALPVIFFSWSFIRTQSLQELVDSVSLFLLPCLWGFALLLRGWRLKQHAKC